MLVGAADQRDEAHEDGRDLLRAVATGALGVAFISDFVMDEAVTILGRRRGVGARVAATFAEGVLASDRVRCLYVGEEALRETLALYPRFGGVLSVTDTSTVVLMRRAGCRTLFSHDADFDRVPGVERRTLIAEERRRGRGRRGSG